MTREARRATGESTDTISPIRIEEACIAFGIDLAREVRSACRPDERWLERDARRHLNWRTCDVARPQRGDARRGLEPLDPADDPPDADSLDRAEGVERHPG
jgi:hypothetical protein